MIATSWPALSPEAEALRDGFLRWQCRVRQIAMREAQGRPDEGAMPAVQLPGAAEPMGQIITVLSRDAVHSLTPEMQHIAKSTFDPAQRRDKAITFFSATYYQKHRQFSDTLTATFQSGSKGAATLLAERACRLKFSAYSQSFELDCQVFGLREKHYLYQATWWHNQLFNPRLAPATTVLGFAPDWQESRADPPIRAK